MRLLSGLAVASLCLGLALATSTAGGARVQPRALGAVSSLSTKQHAEAPAWLVSLARRLVQWKEVHGEVATEVGSELLKEWLREEKCSNLLPSPFFC
jgi:hypothetical protein